MKKRNIFNIAAGKSVGLVKFALAQIMRGLVIKVLTDKVEAWQ